MRRENPGKPPRAIAEILKGKGVNVNAQYVSIVKSNMKGKRGRKTVKVRKMQAAAAAADRWVPWLPRSISFAPPAVWKRRRTP